MWQVSQTPGFGEPASLIKATSWHILALYFSGIPFYPLWGLRSDRLSFPVDMRSEYATETCGCFLYASSI